VLFVAVRFNISNFYYICCRRADGKTKFAASRGTAAAVVRIWGFAVGFTPKEATNKMVAWIEPPHVVI
jgi:hypothetical protein